MTPAPSLTRLTSGQSDCGSFLISVIASPGVTASPSLTLTRRSRIAARKRPRPMVPRSSQCGIDHRDIRLVGNCELRNFAAPLGQGLALRGVASFATAAHEQEALAVGPHPTREFGDAAPAKSELLCCGRLKVHMNRISRLADGQSHTPGVAAPV